MVNSDLVPSTMPNYYPYHVIYTSYIRKITFSDLKSRASCAAAEAIFRILEQKKDVNRKYIKLTAAYTTKKTRIYIFQHAFARILHHEM